MIEFIKITLNFFFLKILFLSISLLIFPKVVFCLYQMLLNFNFNNNEII